MLPRMGCSAPGWRTSLIVDGRSLTGTLRRRLGRVTHAEPAWPVAGPDELRQTRVPAENSADLTQIIYASHLRLYVPDVGRLS
jgi:hypothetical protein